MTNFDIFKNIVKKEKKIDDTSELEPIGLNRILSFDVSSVFLVNALNAHVFRLSKNLVYLFYYYSIEKRKNAPFLPIKKNEDVEWEKLKDIAKELLPDMSFSKIREIFPLIREDLIKMEKEGIYGGTKKK